MRLRNGSGIPGGESNDMTMFRHPVLELSHDRGRFTKNVRDELHVYDTGGASSDVSAYTSTLHSTFPRSWQSNWVVREERQCERALILAAAVVSLLIRLLDDVLNKQHVRAQNKNNPERRGGERRENPHYQSRFSV